MYDVVAFYILQILFLVKRIYATEHRLISLEAFIACSPAVQDIYARIIPRHILYIFAGKSLPHVCAVFELHIVFCYRQFNTIAAIEDLTDLFFVKAETAEKVFRSVVGNSFVSEARIGYIKVFIRVAERIRHTPEQRYRSIRRFIVSVRSLIGQHRHSERVFLKILLVGDQLINT